MRAGLSLRSGHSDKLRSKVSGGTRCPPMNQGKCKMTIRQASKAIVATLVLSAWLLPGGTAAAAPPNDGLLPKDVKVPNDAAVAIYLPSVALKYRFYVGTLGIWA